MHTRGNARMANRAAAGKAVLPALVERLLNLEWPGLEAHGTGLLDDRRPQP